MTHSNDALVVEFLHYHCWANLQLLDACSRLSAEQLAAGAPGVYGSIYDTLGHLLRSDASYLRRISGVTIEPPFTWEAAPTPAQMRAFAEQVGAALVEAARRMQPGDTLPRDWMDPEWESYPARFRAVGMLIQVLDHGIEHRTNITTVMAQSGLEPPYLDGWEYMRRNPDRMVG